MKNNHYEYKDYEILKRYFDKSLSLLSSQREEAFIFILHDFYNLLCDYDPMFAGKIYGAIKECQNDKNFDVAIKKLHSLIDEYFQNIIVDINEHNKD